MLPKPLPVTPLEQPVRAVLSLCLPQVTLESLRVTSSPRLQRIYTADLADGTCLTLFLPPPSTLRLLRSEKCLVEGEIAVVAWLRSIIRIEIPGRLETSSHFDGDGISCNPRGTVYSNTGYEPRDPGPRELIDFLPIPINQTLTPQELGIPYSIYRQPKGSPISSLKEPLTLLERRSVNYQIGRLFRRLSKFTSPTNRFGPAHAVLASSQQRAAGGPVLETGDARTWAVAFHVMLEGILRDGEDMAITLPYSAIRKHAQDATHVLELVEAPCLVLAGFDDANVLVTQRQPCPWYSSSSNRRESPEERVRSIRAKHSDDRITSRADSRRKTSSADDSGGTIPSEGPVNDESGGIWVTGLLDWSSCIFGDPLLAAASNANPSQCFLRGLREGDECHPLKIGNDDDPRDKKEPLDTRLLLYQLYFAVSGIVREFYRPQLGWSEREMAARRRLNTIIRKLDHIEVGSV